MGNRTTVPEKMFLGGSGDHGTPIDVGVTSSKPSWIRLLEILIDENAITISKQSHVDKSLCEGAMCSMTRQKELQSRLDRVRGSGLGEMERA